MKTIRLKADQLEEAVHLLKEGEIVALPTETVYGLAADARNEKAILKIFMAKERPLGHPLILHIASTLNLRDWAENISADVEKLTARFWPGPLTLILEKKKGVSDLITGGLETIGVRMPDHPLTLNIIRRLGSGIVAPSANAHKKTSPTRPDHVLKTLEGRIPAILDGGECSLGIESTILDMTQETPIILRAGAITAAMIEEVIQREVKCPFVHAHKVAGNMKEHYQPDKPLFVLSQQEIRAILAQQKNVAVISYSFRPEDKEVYTYQMPKDVQGYSQKLYAALHASDQAPVEKILVEAPPTTATWAAVNDRLLKASAGRI